MTRVIQLRLRGGKATGKGMRALFLLEEFCIYTATAAEEPNPPSLESAVARPGAGFGGTTDLGSI